MFIDCIFFQNTPSKTVKSLKPSNSYQLQPLLYLRSMLHLHLLYILTPILYRTNMGGHDLWFFSFDNYGTPKQNGGLHGDRSSVG